MEKEGWSPQGDDAPTHGQLALFPASYRWSSAWRAFRCSAEVAKRLVVPCLVEVENPRRDFICAAALIVVEIERLDGAPKRKRNAA